MQALPEISILFPGLRIPRRALVGARERHSRDGEYETARTWNGAAVSLAPSWGEKVNISISNDGERVWTPSTDNLVVGQQLTLWSSVWRTVTIPPGQYAATLARDPVPGTVHATDAMDPRIEVESAVNGRIATIPFRGGWTTVSYRPAYDCMVLGITEMGAETTAPGQSWTLELTER
ncbi:hypothetical protein SAMN06297251_10135 [Fulvimarina manganoxydans]|uniref:Uncharacterized protein n=1 Tax=Fulvimarina manganoxydans TaxID=937218 RepID=A0A1W1Y8G7_9HYPH|nr:hypothetical protein [Fulvimarina manganoxydans]SMC32462.1 hypothetical protein SAMN06297251_10135 [Fulvimarina manganoxydans]